jgi:hypothetical protein
VRSISTRSLDSDTPRSALIMSSCSQNSLSTVILVLKSFSLTVCSHGDCKWLMDKVE